MDFNNIDLTSGYEKDLNVLDGMSTAQILLQIECNLPIITKETILKEVKAEFHRNLISAVQTLEANIDNITAYAINERKNR